MDMEKQVNYKPRIADRLLARKLEGMGAVLIEGPKWCGKTTTAEQQARSILYMDDPREKMQNIQAADINPEMLLAGDTPRLIDEWQIAPQLWDAIRFSVDHRNMDGQFILTGSAVPPIVEDSAVVSHTGTGRVVRLRMRPMSLWESGDSNGSVSLGALFQGHDSIMGIAIMTSVTSHGWCAVEDGRGRHCKAWTSRWSGHTTIMTLSSIRTSAAWTRL